MNLSPFFALNVVRRSVLVILISGLAGVLVAGLLIPLAASLGVVARDSANEFGNMTDDIDLNQPLYQRSRVVDAEGRTIATFYDQNRVYVPLDKVAPVMQEAILAIEDHRFYEHGPIDFQGTMRAFSANLQAGSVVGGGSTLTQQYVKLLQVNREGVSYQDSDATEISYRRKLEELRLALQVEQQLSKDQILERYLNIAYFGTGGGGGVHGIEAAARAYFSTSASELTLEQAAMLAGLVQQPTRYDPTKNEAVAIARRNTVLDRMADPEVGMITEDEATKAQSSDLGLELRPTPNGCVGSPAPFYCEYFLQEVRQMEALGDAPDEREAALNRAGLTIRTTFDRENQQAAQEAIDERMDPTDSAAVALASVEPGTGKIRAIAQSRLYGDDEDKGETYINLAVPDEFGDLLGSQPGSTYKAFVLAAAIKQGIPLDTSFYSPHSMTIPENDFDMCDGPRRSTVSWPVSNYSSSVSNRRHNVFTGTEQSVNTFYAQLERMTGLCEPAQLALDLGVEVAPTWDLEEDFMAPSFVLGANATSPLSMAEAYATFAARGMHCDSYAIEEIVDRNGETIHEAEPQCERALPQDVADGVNLVLKGVIYNSGGTGGGMRLDDGRDAGGKTGTNNNTTSVWWVGYIPQLATAIGTWDPDGTDETLHGRTFGGEVIDNVCGGCVPGPIWKNTMEAIIDKFEPKSFPEPDDEVVRGEEDPVPDVRGMSEGQARDTLESADFQPYVAEEQESENFPEGEVVSTTPGANSQHEIGGQVGLIVSSGPPPPPESDSDEPSNGDNGDGDNGGDDQSGDGDSGGNGGGGDGDGSGNGDDENGDGDESDDADDSGGESTHEEESPPD